MNRTSSIAALTLALAVVGTGAAGAASAATPTTGHTIVQPTINKWDGARLAPLINKWDGARLVQPSLRKMN